jgi:predicted alpha/beta hydrolase
MVKQQNIRIPASDGLQLAAIYLSSEVKPKACVLVCPGLGIPKEFYLKFCNYLASNEYAVLTFDYRGIGRHHDDLGEDTTNLRNWGIHDLPGAIRWLHGEHENLDVYLIGHSIAGQVSGLMQNHALIKKFIFVSSTGGHFSLFGFPTNLFAFFMFWIHLPITTYLLGYLPPSLTYRGVRIAGGVSREWATWSRQRDYIAAFFGKTIQKNYYEEITQTIDWIWMSEDRIAPDKAVKFMMNFYKNANIVPHKIDTKSLDLKNIGHAGLFTSRGNSKLWDYTIKLLEE